LFGNLGQMRKELSYDYANNICYRLFIPTEI